MKGRSGRLAVLVVALASIATSASAQRGTLNRFGASETPEDDFHLSRPTDLGHLRWGAQLHLDYAHDPLVWESELGDAGSEDYYIVDHQLTATLGASLGLFDRVVVFAGLPVVLVQNGDGEDTLAMAGVPTSADGAGLGDAYLGARVRIWGEADDPFAVGAQLTATVSRLKGGKF